MNYRFLKLQTNELLYLRPFLARHPEAKELSYRALVDLYVRECHGWHLNYSPYLTQLGNEADEICINFDVLQKQWARENGVNFDGRNWLKDIVAAQLHKFKPDVLLLDDLYFMDRDFRRFLRESCPTPVKIIGWRAAPTDDYSIFRDVDLMLTCTPLFVRQMREHGVTAELMLHAFEPSILGMTDVLQRDIDLSFVGSIALMNGFHNERWELLTRLLRSTDLQIWGEIIEPRQNSQMTHKLRWRINRVFDLIGAGEVAARVPYLTTNHRGPEATLAIGHYGDRIHPQVLALEYFKVLAHSKLNINKHIDCAGDYAGNVRLFEATGMGACLITDWKINLPEMFEPDAEIVTYRTPDECAEKVRYLLDHDSERQTIAASGQRRTLRDHTYAKRAEQLDGIIRAVLRGTGDHIAYSIGTLAVEGKV